jgi:Zn ribbon nucleic-acid-binding protein
VKCPDCGKTDTLSAWNPVECHCPKCGSSMKEDESAGWIMAD